MMKKALMGLSAAALIAAGAASPPTPAQAYPAWVIPAVIGAAFGGIVLGTVATQSAYAYDRGPAYVVDPAPPVRSGTIYVRPSGPAAGCRIVRQRTADGGYRRVEGCRR